MPEYIITACWILLFLFCIYRFRFFEVTGITKLYSYAALLFKFLLGFANYYIWLNVIGHGDSLRFFHDSKLVYNTLFEHPAHYFQLLTGYSEENIPQHLEYVTSQLNIDWHVSEYHMVRLLAILNVFSFGSAWGNIVILSFISFVTSVSLFKTITGKFNLTAISHRLIFGVIFFLPSLIFWSSGLLKECPTYILMSIIYIQLIHCDKRFELKRIIYIAVALILLLLIRDYLFYLLLVNLIIWFCITQIKSLQKKPGTSYFIITGIVAGILLILPLLDERLSLVKRMQEEQKYFLLEEPDPDYQFYELDGTLIDITKKTPYVIQNITFRPNLFQSNSLFRIYQSAELITIWLAIAWLLYRNRKNIPLSPGSLLLLFVCLELLYIYGLMVTDADTLSRYRSIPLAFLLILALIHKQKPFKLVK